MKYKLFAALALTVAVALGPSTLRAQLVNDGATNTLNNVTNFIAGDVTVGTNGSFTLLILTNNALLTNSSDGFIGYNSGANSNTVRLAGANTRWLLPGDLSVGSFGAGNQLVVSNGSMVRDRYGILGYLPGSSNNVATVTGAGSLWTNALDTSVGLWGVGNRLVVSNGGVVRGISGNIGSQTPASNNVALVTDAGSLWTNAFELHVGISGSGNQLVVSNGGTVVANNGVFMGDYGTSFNNLLLLSTGALLTNGNDGVLGVQGGVNTAFLSGLNTRWLMGGNLHVGSNGVLNRLVISNSALVGNDYGYLGDTAASIFNEAVVTGTGSVWSNRLGLHVGNSGGWNRLTITNGGMARNLNGLLGLDSTSGNNVALVTGPSSLWTNQATLSVGYSGAGNQLVVTNGGDVLSTDGYVGRNATSANNSVVVTGAGSSWTNQDSLSVGYDGAGNLLVVTNGGVVRNSIGCIGTNSISSNNVVTVTGAGSLWSNADNLYVGYFGSGNQLVITNGGVVHDNGISYVGLVSTSSSNAVMVTGAGSRWTNEGSLHVGFQGSGNQLVVSNGGVVSDWYAEVGYNYSSNNSVVVTGPGSRWENQSSLDVGSGGVGNQLVISNGGVVLDDIATIGFSLNDFSSSNVVVVTGAGSLWTNAGFLIVGRTGAGNQLVVNNGGMVRNSHCEIGYFFGSDNNSAVVSGAGSRWENQGELDVGSGSSGNQLVVSNGAVVRNYEGVLGYTYIGNSNVAVVTGAGSRWTNDANLYVGLRGAGNQLVVTNGGMVRNADGYLGFALDFSNSTNNLAVVTGPGSLWMNVASLNVGFYWAGNQLVVTNGGVVRNTTGTVGNNIGADFNLARVTGVGSLWTNTGSLLIGSNGAFNQLIVSAGGRAVAAGPVTLGVAATATNNSVVAMSGSLASVGLNLGGAASRNNSVTLLSGSAWDVGGGPFIWGNAGSNDTLTIDATSALTNIGALWLDETATAFRLTNAPGGYTLNGFTTNQFQFKTNGLGALVVGNDGTNVQLTISNYSLVSTTGTIGNNAAAWSNLVLVAGAGSVWSNSGAINIGKSGAFNQLVVSNGGAVRAGGLVTLGYAVGSTNNSVLAEGGLLSSAGLTLGNVQSRNNSVALLSGSVWDVGGGTFTWGNAGINDTLTIDGTSSMTNIGALTLDENNTAFVFTNGPGGSALNGMAVRLKPTGFGALIVGNDGTNVQLTISNTLADTTGTIGNNASSLSNSVFVTGASSLWTNRGTLTIGNSGDFNQLVVSNAATVAASNHVVIGFNSGAVNNSLSLLSGAWLTNGGDGVLGWSAGANSNSVFVSGTNSRWHVGNSLCVGTNGAGNQLVISNGGTVIAGSGLSVFTGGGVFVGANAGASNNLLSLSDGAQMTNGGHVALGWNAGANSNTVSLSGANTLWQLLPYAYFYVGNSGAGNRLVISNGAQLRHTYSTDAHIGYNASAINNEVFVTGANSLWTVDGNLIVGLHGGGSRMVISDGAQVNGGSGWIGPPNAASPVPVSNNVVLVTGANSRWDLSYGLVVGHSGDGSLVVSNGGGVNSFSGGIGLHPVFGNTNRVLVTGASSYWTNQNSFYVGQGSSGNSLVISNGAWVDDNWGYIGGQTTAETNEVVVTGAGSVWNHRSELHVGYDGAGNRLLITNGAAVFVANKAYVGFGFFLYASNNLLTVNGGSFTVTNLAGSGALDVRYGSNILNAGLMDADRLILTNTSLGGSFFNFNGGTLKTKNTTCSNGQLFTVGNGTSAAAFELAGNGLHTFSNGLAIANNATLRGNGTISGALTVAIGGTLSPGTSVGKIILSNAPALQGATVMEISRNGAVLTNDQIQVAGTLTYGGSLTVSNLGPNALAVGNNFKLFAASSYLGAFSILSLPSPGVGLGWTNKLLLDGSIEVIAAPTVPAIAGISVSGTNIIISGSNGPPNTPYAVLTATNVALPLSNWVSIATNQFDSSGNFSFTNGITFGTSQRFFRIRTP